MIGIVAFVVIPSFFVTISMVRQSIFEDNARKFCKEVSRLETSHLIGNTIDYKNRNIRLVFMGDEVDSASIRVFESELLAYDLENVTLEVIQRNAGINEDDVKDMVKDYQEIIMANTKQKSSDDKKIERLENDLSDYQNTANLAEEILPEVRILFPSVTSLGLAKGRIAVTSDTLQSTPATIAIITAKPKLSQSERGRLSEWLKKRIGREDLVVWE